MAAGRGVQPSACITDSLSVKTTENGDLTEKFAKDVKMFGRRGAEWLYFKRVGKSAWPYLRRWLLKLGVFAWIADLARRIGG